MVTSNLQNEVNVLVFAVQNNQYVHGRFSDMASGKPVKCYQGWQGPEMSQAMLDQVGHAGEFVWGYFTLVSFILQPAMRLLTRGCK